MAGDWTTIGDIAEVFDGPHATPKKIEEGPYFLSISSLEQGKLDLSKSAHISEEQYIKWTKRVTPQEGDVLFSYETRLGEAALMPGGIKACLGRRMGLLRPNKEVVDPSYLLFAYLSPDFQREIVARTNSGATVDRIALKELPSFPIRIPKLQEQREIASVLSALDNKIELNRQINATLESMAQALFKSWFVDFDPVIDNALAAGNPIPEPLQARAEKRAALLAASAADTRSPNATDNTHPTQTAPHTQSGTTAPATPLQPLPPDLRALFPDSFVFNEEMGWVPAGWPSGLLDEIAHYGSERISVGEIGHANYVSTENLIPERGGVREASSLPTSEWVPAFTDGSILVSNIRPYFKKIWMARRVGGRSNDVLGFESRLAGAEEYLYCLLCQDKFFDYMMATAKGTKMPRGDKKAIMNWQVVIPSDQLMREFSSIIRGFLLSAQARSEQSLSLASIRDSILPRLLRGEIRIEDVHQSLAEVV